MANDPGWYPDPWRPGQRRWWDGSGWTDHTWDPSTAPAGGPAAPAGSGPARAPGPPPHVAPQYAAFPDPTRDLADEARAAVWAKRGFVAFFVSRVIGGLVALIVLDHLIDDIRHAIDTNTDVQTNNSASVLNLPVTILSVLGLVAVIMWTTRAVTVARNLRYPAKRSPGWAVAGWLVPVVNLWFPYQAVRDCLAPGNPERRTVKQWWAVYVIGLFVWVPAMVVSVVWSYALAVAVALPAVVLGIIELSLAFRVVDAVHADHSAAIQRVIAS